MTQTAEPTKALATRDLTDKQLLQRIELNKKAGWGLEKGNPAQLNMVFLLCQKYRLLPGDDVTLYEGKPWITIDGRVKLMRRHSEYRGYSTRPLTVAEKELWGYGADDVVIECTVRTTTWGDIVARGKVTAAEKEGRQARSNPVAKVHWVELAEKRAISRAEARAFGADAVIDEDEAEAEVRTIVQERTNPERVALNAATYDRAFGSDDDGTAYAEMPVASPESETRAAPPAPAPAGEMVKSVKHPRYQVLSERVEQVGLVPDADPAPYTVKLPAALSLIEERIAAAEKVISDYQEQAESQAPDAAAAAPF